MNKSLQEKVKYLRSKIRSKQITLCVEKLSIVATFLSVNYRRTYLCMIAISSLDDDMQLDNKVEEINRLDTTISNLILQGKIKYETL